MRSSKFKLPLLLIPMLLVLTGHASADVIAGPTIGLGIAVIVGLVAVIVVLVAAIAKLIFRTRK